MHFAQSISHLPKPPFGKTGWPWTEETDPSVFDNNKVYPKISIVTPSYNQGHFIEKTIRSILLQNYPNLEFIIIDGGSTDNTIEIIKKYEPWISYWVSEKDKGIYDAMNKGLSVSTGDWINFMNIQDYFLRNAFTYLFAKFISSKKVIYSDAYLKDDYGNLSYYKHHKPIKNLFILSNMLHQALFFNNLVAKKYPYNLDFKIMADLNVCVKLYFLDRLAFGLHVNKPTVVYKLGGFSHQNSELMQAERYKIIKMLPFPYNIINILNHYRIFLIKYFK